MLGLAKMVALVVNSLALAYLIVLAHALVPALVRLFAIASLSALS